MINKLSKTTGLLLLIIGLASNNLQAQTQKDSSNAEIKKQAVAMREKLNSYLAVRLAENKELNMSGKSSDLNDSLLNTIVIQQMELNDLKEKYKTLETLVENLTTTNKLSADKANGAFVNPSTGGNYIQYADKQLNLYFSNNDFTLNENQIAVLNSFLENKKRKRATVISYTDWRGKAKTNTLLGEKRAAVITKLLKSKVKSYSVSVNTKCKMNMTNEGLNVQWCRRIEIILE